MHGASQGGFASSPSVVVTAVRPSQRRWERATRTALLDGICAGRLVQALDLNLDAQSERRRKDLTGYGVQCQLLDMRVVRVKTGKYAMVALRTIVVDPGGMPWVGDIEKGESSVHETRAKSDDLIVEALREAAPLSVKALGTMRIPDATVLFTTSARPVLNRGSRDGFRAGERFIVLRQGRAVGSGRLGALESDQSEPLLDPGSPPLSPGDRVRVANEIPSMPPPGLSVFDAQCSGMGRGRRKRPWWRSW